MMPPERQGERYRVRTIVISDGRGGAYPTMLVRFNGNGNKALEGNGWRSSYLLCVNMEPGIPRATTGFHEYTRMFHQAQQADVGDFLVAVEKGRIGMDEIQDGATYTVNELKQMVNG